MLWLLTSVLAYLLTTTITLWLIRYHLLRMRSEVVQHVEALVAAALEAGKQQVRDSAYNVRDAVVQAMSFSQLLKRTPRRADSDFPGSESQSQSNPARKVQMPQQDES